MEYASTVDLEESEHGFYFLHCGVSVDVVDSVGVKSLFKIGFSESDATPEIVFGRFCFVVTVDEHEFTIPFATVSMAKLLSV